ncbi:hypothetical protein JCM8547_000300 [Rhodosporidiobolus lusitaniae]
MLLPCDRLLRADQLQPSSGIYQSSYAASRSLEFHAKTAHAEKPLESKDRGNWHCVLFQCGCGRYTPPCVSKLSNWDYTGCLAHAWVCYREDGTVLEILGYSEHNRACKSERRARGSLPLHKEVIEWVVRLMQAGIECNILKCSSSSYSAMAGLDEKTANHEFLIEPKHHRTFHRRYWKAFLIDVRNSLERSRVRRTTTASGLASVHRRCVMQDGSTVMVTRSSWTLLRQGGHSFTAASYDTKVLTEMLVGWKDFLGKTANGESFSPKLATTDTDVKGRTALGSVFPGIRLRICRFHLRQAWKNKRSQCVGGTGRRKKSAPSNPDDLLVKLIAAPFLPAAVAILNEVKTRIATAQPSAAVGNGARVYLAYLLANWLKLGLFDDWSDASRDSAARALAVPLDVIVNTSNHLESFNNLVRRILPQIAAKRVAEAAALRRRRPHFGTTKLDLPTARPTDDEPSPAIAWRNPKTPLSAAGGRAGQLLQRRFDLLPASSSGFVFSCMSSILSALVGGERYIINLEYERTGEDYVHIMTCSCLSFVKPRSGFCSHVLLIEELFRRRIMYQNYRQSPCKIPPFVEIARQVEAVSPNPPTCSSPCTSSPPQRRNTQTSDLFAASADYNADDASSCYSSSSDEDDASPNAYGSDEEDDEILRQDRILTNAEAVQDQLLSRLLINIAILQRYFDSATETLADAPVISPALLSAVSDASTLATTLFQRVLSSRLPSNTLSTPSPPLPPTSPHLQPVSTLSTTLFLPLPASDAVCASPSASAAPKPPLSRSPLGSITNRPAPYVKLLLIAAEKGSGKRRPGTAVL